jgi:hypothetical protein
MALLVIIAKDICVRCNNNNNMKLYSKGMHPVARVIKPQNKTLVRNN